MHHAFLFGLFNALSYQIVLSSPIILYAKSLGASATVLGVIAGMMPFLVIFQIPAASYIPRIGFKRFVLGGWSIRVVFILAMALVAWSEPLLDARNRLALLLFLLFGFNLSRGISSCAWLPWIAALVPAQFRGAYLTRDAFMNNLGSLGSFLFAAWVLGGQPRAGQFALLFLFSAVTGAISLAFLKRIPDAAVPDEPRGSRGSVPWLEMMRYAPFARLLRVVVGWSVAYGGVTAFTVAFLKSSAGMSEGKILLISAAMFLGGMASLWLLGSRFDRVGSKPVLAAACAGWVAVMTGWVALAGGLVRASVLNVLVLQALMGLLAAMVNMANARLAMAIAPAMARNHFLAIYSVVGNVTLGLSPIGWGILIDAYGLRAPQVLGVEWNRFTVFFAATAVAFGVMLALSRQLEEPKAATLEELLRELLIESPQRFWLRLWPR
ncbi:MAG: MFS transporter [Verrucomicrobiales bacterium]|nr:MFS transporter [Verrucomicrobiales bacterium]